MKPLTADELVCSKFKGMSAKQANQLQASQLGTDEQEN